MKTVNANNNRLKANLKQIYELGTTPYFSRVSYNIPYIYQVSVKRKIK